MLRFGTALALIATAAPALAEEVNLYSYRQPELLQPLTDAFTEATGIEVNVAYIDKGLEERLVAEGDRSPGLLQVRHSRAAAGPGGAHRRLRRLQGRTRDVGGLP